MRITKRATTTSRRMKTTRSGRLPSRRLLLTLLLPAALFAAGPKPKEKPKKLTAVIAGTVFRDPGFAMAGVEVELVELRPDGKKGKSRKTLTDGRGEFAFLVPPEERKYKVKVQARGLQPEEKDAESAPGARIDVFFTLKPLAP